MTTRIHRIVLAVLTAAALRAAPDFETDIALRLVR